jgi:hypothetical protein
MHALKKQFADSFHPDVGVRFYETSVLTRATQCNTLEDGDGILNNFNCLVTD